jgi:nucleoid-associated protein YgaU
MLVGVLAMVIVIAVIWDRQSSDLKKTVSVRMDNSGKKEGPPPTLSTGDSKAKGVIELGPRTPEQMETDAVLSILQEEFPRSHRPEPSVVQPEPAAVQEVSVPAATGSKKVKSYIVEAGESFWTIARDHYGDATLWEKLWKANKDRFPRPEDLREGATIILPNIKRTWIGVPDNKAPQTLTQDGKRYYTVKEGDCLGIISTKFYGTCKKWQLILDANNLVDERSLRAGMKIVIPPAKK